MNEPIMHETELGEDVPLMLYSDMKTESDLSKNIDTLSDLVRKLFGDKNYLLVQTPAKFFTNNSIRGHILLKNGSYELLHSFNVRQANTDINWNFFLYNIDNLIIYEFSSKCDLDDACSGLK